MVVRTLVRMAHLTVERKYRRDTGRDWGGGEDAGIRTLTLTYTFKLGPTTYLIPPPQYYKLATG